MPRVISYTRFSSRKQAAGDSYRRQTEAALRWCKEHGHELDTSLVLEDLGISGYSGANAKRGALGVLQMMVLDSKIEKGTILLIEAFDRLTRLPLPDAYEV
ncbi:MAG: recombinase family protein, partial [Azoarcus sp.]|nr:recombinase family protein [Azoarcus sp.]